jgi:carbonic anhydrase
MLLIQLIAALSFSLIVSAHPHPHGPLYFPKFRREVGSSSAPFSAAKFPVVMAAMEGNARFRETRNETLMHSLVANGQKPPFMVISCSDSRAPEATIFDSQPGTFFMERNIANQYKPGDENVQR